jgi:hypothetical protein
MPVIRRVGMSIYECGFRTSSSLNTTKPRSTPSERLTSIQGAGFPLSCWFGTHWFCTFLHKALGSALKAPPVRNVSARTKHAATSRFRLGLMVTCPGGSIGRASRRTRQSRQSQNTMRRASGLCTALTAVRPRRSVHRRACGTAVGVTAVGVGRMQSLRHSGSFFLWRCK